MAVESVKRQARSRIMDVLKKELMGPGEPEEVLEGEYPTNRYIVGRLAPANDEEAIIRAEELDTLGAGNDDPESGMEEPTLPLITAFRPSSMGLSFLIDRNVTSVDIDVEWGDYKREKNEEGKYIWRRYPRKGVVSNVPVPNIGTIKKICLSDSEQHPSGVSVEGVDDPEVYFEGVVHDFAGYKAVSLFMVNDRQKGKQSDRDKDERWVYQPQFTVRSKDNQPIFVAKDFVRDDSSSEQDGDNVVNALLYRHVREFATGHGVAAEWDAPVELSNRTTAVRTEFIPHYEIPILIAPSEKTGGAILDMKLLAEAGSPRSLVGMLEPMVNAYEAWISDIVTESQSEEIQHDKQLKEAAEANIEKCQECLKRMREGLELLLDGEDSTVIEAFKFANKVMWDQRIHSIWAADNSRNLEIKRPWSDFDTPYNRTWRPFQMGFILLNLKGIAIEDSIDRSIVDLLYFPTGGGKTEAYLGLSAFALALRRLKGERYGMDGGAGVSIIMRYTLRLLTVQQFQRASALIAACEVERRSNTEKWGSEPFRIGLWVGRSTTPNTFIDSYKALEDINNGKKPKEGSPVQVVSCPRCGTMLVTDKGVPESQTYYPDKDKQRTFIRCRNDKCEFCARKSKNEGLPIVVVDEEIYRTCPSMVIATVDKFARLPFKGETQSLFGFRDRFSPTYGHLMSAHGDKPCGRVLRDAVPAKKLLPPDLIIQDELHLISGPLGTMVGLYETAVDYLTQVQGENKSLKAKIIASTATIRRAHQQVAQLYARKLNIFPASGIVSKNSFFAREVSIDLNDDKTAGRLYLGINAPGSSEKTVLVRIYAALLAAAQAELDNNPKAGDPYSTLVGYFNSLRALGGTKRLVEDDVKIRLKYLNRQRGFPQRTIPNIAELTSRMDSWKIPNLLKQLDLEFPRPKTTGMPWPIDILLATNMISVGVDIDRLGVMVVAGQPKSTAEYIQATSRIGRKHPGLVVTTYNWLGARDLSHYERFKSYHSALYRYVEAISVTPFSSRALDRGLRALFAGINRLAGGPNLSKQPDAQNFDNTEQSVETIRDYIVGRAERIVGIANSNLVNARLLNHQDEWMRFTDDLLRYTWLDNSKMPPNNSRVLLKTAGTENEGEWTAPGSLREVEPTAGFYLAEEDA